MIDELAISKDGNGDLILDSLTENSSIRASLWVTKAEEIWEAKILFLFNFE
jgi:hypothetical protein